ncbi:hypothetical protein [Ramlibacter rhizophilus]|uniref:Uncharacterized protein n=1 Tax=Ramlibacter rhizophilus TaxID=1781167 RepID=A0A4Z0BFB1_9BURK|nr:hypothetical protein [Ramlibacter rhizophilus]TFY96814.1 hypothetical protein EZ242_19230 [Ramlibacter rhizophilus]
MNRRSIAAAFLLAPVVSWAAPVSGSYVTDVAVQYVEDDVFRAMAAQTNMALCILSQAIPPSIVNRYRFDPYLALVDGAKCQLDGAQQKLIRVSATSSRNEGEPQISKGHIAPDVSDSVAIAFHLSAAREPVANDFGEWTLRYTVYDNMAMLQRGRIEATGTSLTMSVEAGGPMVRSLRLAIALSSRTDGRWRKGAFEMREGAGVLQGGLAQNGSTYCVSLDRDPPEARCFDTDPSGALPVDTRYRLYDDVTGAVYESEAARLILRSAKGGFAYATYRQVVGSGLEGSVFSPLSGAGAYKVYRPAGSLLRSAVESVSFDDLAMRPFRATFQRAGASLPEPVEMRWNASQQRFEVIGVFSCYDGCVSDAITPESVSHADLVNRGAKDFAFVKPADLGTETLRFNIVPGASIDVAPRMQWLARTFVEPNSPAMTLRCARDCPTAARIATATEAARSYVPETIDQVAADVVVSYTWDPLQMVLRDQTGMVVSTEGTDLPADAGLLTGPLIPAAIFDEAQAKCLVETGAACAPDSLAMLASESFRWLMLRGDLRPAFLVAADGSYKTLERRPRALWQVPDSPERYGSQAGNVLDLFVDELGGLGGIPLACTDENLERVACTAGLVSQTPAFEIPEDGAVNRVTVNGQTKWVRRVFQKLQLRIVSAPDVEHAVTSGLPALPELFTDAEDPTNPDSEMYAGDPARAAFKRDKEDPAVGGELLGLQLKR